MTTLVLTIPSHDGDRIFEVLVAFEDRLTLGETCIEVYPDDRREWRDARTVLLLVGRKPLATEAGR